MVIASFSIGSTTSSNERIGLAVVGETLSLSTNFVISVSYSITNLKFLKIANGKASTLDKSGKTLAKSKYPLFTIDSVVGIVPILSLYKLSLLGASVAVSWSFNGEIPSTI